MNNYLKRLLCMLMVVTVVFTLFVPAFASMDTATEIVLDKAYSDSIDSNDREDYFKFTTTQYGRVRFYFTTSMRPFTIEILDSKGNALKDAKFVTTRATSGAVAYSYAMDAGTYYLRVNGKGLVGIADWSTGGYEFRLTFTSEIKGQSNVDNDKNNELKYAKEVKFDSTASGKILKDEEENDYFVFNVPTAGTVNMKFTSKMEYYGVYLLNGNGDSIWSQEGNQWDSSKKQRVDNYKFELSAGTYYVKVNSLRGSKFPYYLTRAKGDYSFTLNYKSAGSTSAEPNNSIVNPNKIALNKKIVGHLSMTDGSDYYEINATKGNAMIAFVSYMPSYNIRVLDADNKEIWSSKNNKLDEKATVRRDVHELTLVAGKYFIVVDGGQGKYSFQVAKEVKVNKVKGVKFERTTSSITLKWSAVSGAAGYEVFKYDEAKKEFVKVGSTTSKKYLKIKNLKSGTDYDFKVRAYKKINGCIVYGAFSEEKATTTSVGRATISSVKAGVKSATVTWKAVTGATSYRVYYTRDKDFDYFDSVKIKDGKTTSKTIKNLKSGKKYYFKVKAYKNFNGKNIYGNLSKVKSVKVK